MFCNFSPSCPLGIFFSTKRVISGKNPLVKDHGLWFKHVYMDDCDKEQLMDCFYTSYLCQHYIKFIICWSFVPEESHTEVAIYIWGSNIYAHINSNVLCCLFNTTTNKWQGKHTCCWRFWSCVGLGSIFISWRGLPADLKLLSPVYLINKTDKGYFVFNRKLTSLRYWLKNKSNTLPDLLLEQTAPLKHRWSSM